MLSIYCDEAGNSGANLLDPDQPFFVLASNDYGASEAEDILSVARSRQATEVKFSALKKSPGGVARLIRLLGDPRLHRDRVMISVFHKRFMVTTKLVDLVLETMLHEQGLDLYRGGANIAVSNLLHCFLVPSCGAAEADEFVTAFVELVRRPDPQARDRYLKASRTVALSCTNEGLGYLLAQFANPNLVDSWLPSIGSLSLDPAVPALFQHVVHWGSRKREGFAVVHDRSKPIVASEHIFMDMIARTNDRFELVGYDRRRFEYPLRATSLRQADSVDHPQLQLADVCAGALNHLWGARDEGNLDELALAVEALGCPNWIVGTVLPSTDVTPEELGTDSDVGNNPVDAILRRHGARPDQ